MSKIDVSPNKTLLVVHCADTFASMDIGVEEITSWHKARGWVTIGYAHVIRRNGVVELGRDLDGDGDVADEIGAHALGFNTQSIGICLVGGRGRNSSAQCNFTTKQMRSLEGLVLYYERRFPGIKTVGHCDLAGVTKACPTFDVELWYKESVLEEKP